MADKCVLIIDDEYESQEESYRIRLSDKGYKVVGSPDRHKVLELIKSEMPDVILLDIFFPDGESKPTLKLIKKRYPKTPPVIIISTAMLNPKYHVEDYQLADARYPKELLISKDDFSEFAKFMDGVIEKSKRDKEFDFVIGNTKYMNETLVEQIRLVAATDTTVFITGETGTGKEKVAREIHNLSQRNKGPFIALNCGAIPDSLIESELFGYEKGAFTGATVRKPGRVFLADGGTLFLDEIGDISQALQVKLLRLLREKEYQSLGGTTTSEANVRFIAATNKDLLSLVKEGKYREDLYWRLNVFPIHLPPLRERKDDIELLAKHFIKKSNIPFVADLRDDVKALLLSHDWAGNIGELENAINRALVLAAKDKTLQPIHFQFLVEDKKRKALSHGSKSATEIYEALPNQPMSLKEIAKQYGEATAIEVGSLFLKTKKRWPNEEDAAKLFKSGPGAIRTWLTVRGITKENLNS
jgi:two-component system NtrC family response regulator